MSASTKNLNWESLIKNLVTFNVIMGGSLKNLIFFRGEGTHELKVGVRRLTVFRFKGGGGVVKKERVFSLIHFGR